MDIAQRHCLHLLLPLCPELWVLVQGGGAPAVHRRVHVVVHHKEGSRDVWVGGHEGQALQLRVVGAPGPREAGCIPLTLVEGGHVGHQGEDVAVLAGAHVRWVEVTSVGNAAHVQVRHDLMEPGCHMITGTRSINGNNV